ncbi:MAG: hypothetical protein E7181_03965 [Erysipelotrichaceae bacterium]|jgi:tRNA A-37 threonylcarbamoyl transferase component Bud32|nr:hypothetical protein [Erysipelotrichaceae bacterium]
MENIVIKKKEYTPIKELGENLLLVQREGKKYVVRWLGIKTNAFSDFKYAMKRMKTSNVASPEVYYLDKKTGYALMHYVDGPTMYEELIDHDFDDDVYVQLFNIQWMARKSMMQLDYNPQNFRIENGKIYYIPFTFDFYKKSNDFVEKDLRLWFYTKEFEKMLTENGQLLQHSRLLPDFDLNKKMVLTVVKYYR